MKLIMDDEQEHFAGPRLPVLPSLSSRTLQHPSFMPLYMAAGYARCCRDCYSHTGLAISPQEIFYCDPTSGRRIPNIVSELHTLECLRLNTPPPIMSSCPAPPNRPDPFRSEPHRIRDLGSATWRVDAHQPPMRNNRGILELTQEEEEAITNLLALRHKHPVQGRGNEVLTEPQMDTSAVELDGLSLNGAQYPCGASARSPQQGGRPWSDVELEAAPALFTRISLVDEAKLWTPTGPGSVTETQHNGDDRMSFCEEHVAAEVRNGLNVVDLSGVRTGMLSESEGIAVHMLLSLQDIGTFYTL